MSENIYKDVINHCNTLCVNISDEYMWGCADSEEIDADDIEELVPLFEQYDVGFVLSAYVTVKRAFENPEWNKMYPQDPMMEHYGKSKATYNEVRNKIKDLVSNEKILFDEVYQEKKTKEEIEEFGEPLAKIYHTKIEGLKHYWCIVTVESKEKSGIGRNIGDAMVDLRNKLKDSK